MKNFIFIFTLILGLILFAPMVKAEEPEVASDEIIVKYKDNQSPEDIQEFVSTRSEKQRTFIGSVQNTIENVSLRARGEKLPEEKLNEINAAQRRADVVNSQDMFTSPAIQASTNSDLKDIEVVRTNGTKSINEVERIFEALPEVEYAQPNYIRRARTVPNDTYYPQMWDLNKIQIENAWNITTGSNQVIAAVIDTGVDYNHEDLPTNIIRGPDYANNDNDPMDDAGHGTHVAGTIGAITNNGKGISGINQQIRIMAIKVLRANGAGNDVAISRGITYAADNGAKVINLSLGGPGACSPLWRDSINYARSRGVVVVGATGEGSPSNIENVDVELDTPTSCPGVISVSSTGPNDERASYSYYGNTITIAAPGGDFMNCSNFSSCQSSRITSTYPSQLSYSGYRDNTSKYAQMNGTSMATPHVVGVAALLFAINPNSTPDQIQDLLVNNADTISTDRPIGKRLNAYRSVQAASSQNTSPTDPADSPTATTQPTVTVEPTQVVVPTGPALYFTERGRITPLRTLYVSPGESVSLSLYLSSPTTTINGYDFTISVPSNLTISNVTDGTDAQLFDASLLNINGVSGNSVRFAKTVTNTSNSNLQGNYNIANITLNASSSATNTSQSISFSGPATSNSPAIVSSSNQAFVQFAAQPLTYIVENYSRFNLNLTLQGIGPNGGNKNPNKTERDIKVEVYDAQEAKINEAFGNVRLQQNGTFAGSVDIPNLVTGSYIFKVTVLGNNRNRSVYLTKRMPGLLDVNTRGGGGIDVLPATLVAGDFNLDNKINILDFNLLLACFGSNSSNPAPCQNKNIIDLDDNGSVDNTDFQLLINSLSTQKGD